MSDPVWMKYVTWPACDKCNGKGFVVDDKTQWPVECTKCASGRERAIKDAQNYRKRDMKNGGVG